MPKVAEKKPTIAELRHSLHLTQAELASLLWVHPITVSKWERGILPPAPFRAALLDELRLSSSVLVKKLRGRRVPRYLAVHGPVLCLWFLLDLAYGPRSNSRI